MGDIGGQMIIFECHIHSFQKANDLYNDFLMSSILNHSIEHKKFEADARFLDNLSPVLMDFSSDYSIEHQIISFASLVNFSLTLTLTLTLLTDKRILIARESKLNFNFASKNTFKEFDRLTLISLIESAYKDQWEDTIRYVEEYKDYQLPPLITNNQCGNDMIIILSNAGFYF